MPSSRSKLFIFFVLFLIIVWLTSPPRGSLDARILTHERDAAGTTMFATIEVQNNTYSPFYQVETIVYITDLQGNVVGQKTENVSAVMFPKSKKQIVIRVPITCSDQDALCINAETTSQFLIRSELSGWNTTPSNFS